MQKISIEASLTKIKKQKENMGELYIETWQKTKRTS